MKDWQSQAHVKWECKYHVVILPKYRKKALHGRLRGKIGKILRELCRQKEIELLEGKAMRDHVHMLLSVPPRYSIAMTLGYLKGKSVIEIEIEMFTPGASPQILVREAIRVVPDSEYFIAVYLLGKGGRGAVLTTKHALIADCSRRNEGVLLNVGIANHGDEPVSGAVFWGHGDAAETHVRQPGYYRHIDIAEVRGKNSLQFLSIDCSARYCSR